MAYSRFLKKLNIESSVMESDLSMAPNLTKQLSDQTASFSIIRSCLKIKPV
jgi:hypothetical protein